MNSRPRTLASVLAVTLIGATSQTLQPPPRVVQITLSLVQVDAVVTDKAGRHVSDLTAEDFEILEDGRRQEITNCAYIALPKLAAPAPTAPPPAALGIATPPPASAIRLRPDRVRRTLALVVDDLGLSFRSTVEVREALKKFVDEQMEPGDLVAIIRTRGGIGALQQFTADKAQLHAAIERVRFGVLNRMGVDSFAPIGEGKNLVDTNTGPRGGKAPAGQLVDDLRSSMLTEATLVSLQFVIAGLRDLPGRKGVVLFSDGLPLFQDLYDRQTIGDTGSRGRGGSATRSETLRVAQQSDPRIAGALGELIDFANRASVVLYTVDTRGLATRSLSAGDDVNTLLGTADVQTSDLIAHGAARYRNSLSNEAGLQYVAQQTGGFLVRSSNDLSKSLERVLDDQRGYYLIGYAPDAATFKGPQDRPRFHKIKLTLKRPGLQVRSRAGFYGRIDDGGAVASSEGPRPLSLVLASPFASGDIRLQLTSLFVHEPERGYLMRSLFHVDTRDLALRDVEGMLGTKLELLAVTFGDNGQIVGRLDRVQEIRVAPDRLDQALQEGLTYRLDVPVKQPGAYQLRVAIRDVGTGRVGSANQLVEVPDLGDKKLRLSGIVIGSVPAGAEAAELGSEATAALRRFRPGQALSYGFAVYNAQLDKATGVPRLESQMRLFRDGQPLTLGEKRSIEPSAAGASPTVTSGGGFVLGPEMPPGDYVLQVVVTDALAKKASAMVAQAVDFEVRP